MKKRSVAAVALSFFISILMLGSVLVSPSSLHADGGVTASAGNSSATVTFSPSGGAAQYSATSSPGNLSSPASPSSPLTVSGLTNGISYTFTVTRTDATNSSLVGTSNSVTPSASNTGGSNGNGTSSGDISIQFQLKNPLGATGDLNSFLQNILKAMVLLLTPVVVIMVLYSGFLFVAARGNVEKLGDAKKALLYTLIGAAIVLGAQGFATVLKNTVTCLAGAAGC